MNDQSTRMAEAAGWFAALRRNVMTVDERAAFASWSETAENRAALAQVERAWKTVGALAPDAAHSAKAAPSAPQSRRTLLRVAAVAVAASVTGLAIAYRTGFLPGSQWENEIETGIGEQRELLLADGSVIALNVMSKVRWHVSGPVRKIALETGDALFTVAKDAERPFIVQTSGGLVRAVGTVFAVAIRGRDSRVAVREGTVALMPKAASPDQPTELGAGQAMEFSADRIGPVTEVAPAEIGEWRDHFVTFKNAALSDVLGEVGRYLPVGIRIEPPASAARRITLRLKITDQDSTVTALAKLLGGQIEHPAKDKIVLRFPS